MGQSVQPEIKISPVQGPQALDRFIRLPWSLYANDSPWIPPLVLERRGHLNAKKNPYFQNAETSLWIATRGDRCVGRISAQVNHAYLDRHQDATGHFGFLEAEDDPDVFAALCTEAEDWLKKKGMRRIRGPFSLSINEESGLLVSGFDLPPTMMMPYSRPYYAERLEALGYQKAKDLIAYRYHADLELPAGPRRMIEKALATPDVVLRPASKANYDRDIRIILDIFNDAWAENWGFVPFSSGEIKHVATNLKPLIREELVCIAEVKGEPAAMIVSLPNLNEAIADLNGSLFPFGWAKLLWRLKLGRQSTARVPLMGVRRKHQGTLLGSALAFAIIDRIRQEHLRQGTREVELSWVLEDNWPMRRMIEALGAEAYKTYRIYERSLI